MPKQFLSGAETSNSQGPTHTAHSRLHSGENIQQLPFRHLCYVVQNTHTGEEGPNKGGSSSYHYSVAIYAHTCLSRVMEPVEVSNAVRPRGCGKMAMMRGLATIKMYRSGRYNCAKSQLRNFQMVHQLTWRILKVESHSHRQTSLSNQ